MCTFFLFPPLKINWFQFGGFFVVIPQKKLCWFDFGLGLFCWFVWGFFNRKGEGKEQKVHREGAWKVLWHYHFAFLLTFVRFPVLKHHLYLEAFQDNSGVVVEQKNNFICIPLLMSSNFFFVSWHDSTSTPNFSIFALQLQSSVFPWLPSSEASCAVTS